MLDGKQITDNSRQFLTSWKASREAQQTRERTRPDLRDPSAAYSNHRGEYRTVFLPVKIGLDGALQSLSLCQRLVPVLLERNR